MSVTRISGLSSLPKYPASADGRAKRDRDEDRRDPHRDRDAPTPEHAPEEIAAQVVGPEQVLRGRTQESFREIDRAQGIRVRERLDEDHDHQESEHQKPGDGELVPSESEPGVGPERSYRAGVYAVLDPRIRYF